MMKSRMFDGQSKDETAEEHEICGFQVVDAHLRLESDQLLLSRDTKLWSYIKILSKKV